MAIRALLLRKQIDDRKKALEVLRETGRQLTLREKELEQAINEAETDEELKAAEEAVQSFVKDKDENDKAAQKLSDEISGLEKELEETENKTNVPEPSEALVERKAERQHMTSSRFFGMTVQERDAFFRDEKVKTFLAKIRSCIGEKRALENVGLTIPETVLPLVKQRAESASKLINRVNHIHVGGTARQVIMGTIPEAVWTEMCANLNELDLGFNDAEMDGYKVGGYFAVCNAALEDSDADLMSQIIEALGVSRAKAIDKAILYGTGSKMPLGIVTRLAQTAKPSDYPATSREWTKLSTSHITTGTGKTGTALFKEILTNASAAQNDYTDDGLVWCMSKKTHTKLLIESLDKNMNAALVAGMSSSMPVIGGEIIELGFIPEGDVICGYFKGYTLTERGGARIESSTHYKFVEDRTVFKGTARYDGKPVIPEAFALMSLGTTAPSTSTAFAPDTANTVTENSSDDE